MLKVEQEKINLEREKLELKKKELEDHEREREDRERERHQMRLAQLGQETKNTYINKTNNHKTTREKHNNHIRIQPAPALGRRNTRNQVITQEQMPVEEFHHDSSEDDIEGSSEEDIEIEYTQENPSTDSRNRKTTWTQAIE
ncbi:hypothetical protein Pcinc_003465 [Petrolisthes cinctipes]|uniref:Uncharacterized protein n=1 Tax=Petrolisthes cinctipes TaxID=88211 RepID=A0AAE1L2G4_PETCI|nr:hypothetical protein Pcinc_003465 [Petrolisthes cinctipes]